MVTVAVSPCTFTSAESMRALLSVSVALVSPTTSLAPSRPNALIADFCSAAIDLAMSAMAVTILASDGLAAYITCRMRSASPSRSAAARSFSAPLGVAAVGAADNDSSGRGASVAAGCSFALSGCRVDAGSGVAASTRVSNARQQHRSDRRRGIGSFLGS